MRVLRGDGVDAEGMTDMQRDVLLYAEVFSSSTKGLKKVEVWALNFAEDIGCHVRLQITACAVTACAELGQQQVTHLYSRIDRAARADEQDAFAGRTVKQKHGIHDHRRSKACSYIGEVLCVQFGIPYLITVQW